MTGSFTSEWEATYGPVSKDFVAQLECSVNNYNYSQTFHARILGRSDDMLIIRGVNVFPSQVESVILEMPEFEPHYLIVVDRVNNTDTFQIQVEVRQEFYSDEMNKMIALKKKIANRMQSVIGLQPDIRIVEPRSIERSMGKAKHVIDNRKLE